MAKQNILELKKRSSKKFTPKAPKKITKKKNLIHNANDFYQFLKTISNEKKFSLAETLGFKKWLKEFKISQMGKEVSEIINELTINKNSKAKSWLKREIYWLCFQAKKYDSKSDPGITEYENFSKLKTNLLPTINAIDKLKEFHTINSPLRDKVNGKVAELFVERKIISRSQKSMDELIGEILGIYKLTLEDYESSLKEVTSKGRMWTVAGLIYPNTNEGRKVRKKSHPIRDSFILHLVKIFRHFTAEQWDLGWSGESMPEFGGPCYPQIATIVNSFLRIPEDKILTDDSVQKIASRLIKDGVCVSSWNLPLS